MTAAYLYDAVRTPFGRFNGALAGVRPDDLASYVITALLERNDLAAPCLHSTLEPYISPSGSAMSSIRAPSGSRK